MAGVRFREGARMLFFFFRHRVQTGSGAQWVTADLSLRTRRSEREANHSPPSSDKIKNARIYTSTLPYVFMALYENRDKFNFLL
jgi:hypothetical protein